VADVTDPSADTLRRLAERLAADPGAAGYVRDLAAAWALPFDSVFAAADLLRRERFAAEVRAALGSAGE